MLLALLPVLLSAAQLTTGGGASTGNRFNFVITEPVTYYVCAKANAGTCVYNGDAGTVAATIADTNDCLTKSTPCRTIAGAQAKIGHRLLAAVVTIQLADTAGTSSDLYQPNGTVFDNPVLADQPDVSIYLQEQATNQLGSYPSSYLWLRGNDSTPANVLICGSSSCSTTPTDARGVIFTGTVVRISGVKGEYFTKSPSSAAFYCIRSTCYVENSSFTGTNAASDQEFLIYPSDHAIAKFGGTLTLVDGGLFNTSNYSQVNFRTPAGRASLTVTVQGTFNNGILTANENSYVAVDGLTLTASGAGTYNLQFAQNHSTLFWNDDSTFTSPAWSWSVNGAGITMAKALDYAYIKDACRTISSLTCSIGNTTGIAVRASADNHSYINYLTAGTATTGEVATNNAVIQGPTRSMTTFTATTFANLGSPGNGTWIYCSDCTIANPCAGSGTGAFAKRLNSVWVCN